MEKDKMTPRQRAQRELIGLPFDAREASRREIIEGDRWAKHAGPNGPLQEVLHPETGSPNSDAA
jgi:hypothetical protein